MRRALVVGGGISGLVAAYRLLTADSAARVTVLESSGRLGGCLKPSDLGGYVTEGADVGAEASLYVRPETAALCRELGLELEFPSREHSSRIFSRGLMHPMPQGTLMGVPSDPEMLSDLLSDAELARVRDEHLTPPSSGDVSVGDFLSARLGAALVDTVVDPLLGGVYAGRCRDLSLAATIPALLPAAHEGTSVLEKVAEVQAAKARDRKRQGEVREGAVRGSDVPGAQAADAPPVFMSLRGGISRLIGALAERLTQLGADIRLNTAAIGIARIGERTWRLRTEQGQHTADELVLAVPAYAAADLMQDVDEEIAELLNGVEYATSAVVTAVIDTSEASLHGSGFLIPPTEGAFIKASTFVSNKWPWVKTLLPENTAVVRMSVGRFGDAQSVWAELSDGQVTERAVSDWRRITGRTAPVHHVEVQRWNAALPQYFPGHLGRTARIDEKLPELPGLGLAGSAYDGVGIPACIRRADCEAERLGRHGAARGSAQGGGAPS